MRSNQIRAVIVAMVLGGCTVNTNSRVSEDPPIWGRLDCQRGEGNPELQKHFDDAKATCLARGESAAAVAGTAGSNPCMSEQGYVLRTRSEHAAACQAKKPASKPATTRELTEPAAAGKQ